MPNSNPEHLKTAHCTTGLYLVHARGPTCSRTGLLCHRAHGPTAGSRNSHIGQSLIQGQGHATTPVGMAGSHDQTAQTCSTPCTCRHYGNNQHPKTHAPSKLRPGSTKPAAATPRICSPTALAAVPQHSHRQTVAGAKASKQPAHKHLNT